MPTPTTFSTSSLCALLASVLAFAPSVALAEPPPQPAANPTPEQIERAKELFENGKGLYREGSYDTAIAAFKSAYAQSGDPVLLYNIALAYDRANNFDAALEYLEYYRAFAPESERESLAEKEDSLRKRRLRAQTEQTPKPAEEVEQTPSEPAPQPSTEATTAAQPQKDAPPVAEQPLFTTPVWIFSSIAVVGVGVGAGLGIAALRTTSNARSMCSMGDSDPLCPTSAQNDADRTKRLGLGSDIAFGVGAVAGIVAISLVINNAVKRKKSTNTALVPSRGGAGLAVRF